MPARKGRRNWREMRMSRRLHNQLLTRRGFVKSTALAAFVAAAAGCNVLPGLGAKQKLNVWTDATFAPPSDDYQTKVIEDWAKGKGVEIEVTRETGGDVE